MKTEDEWAKIIIAFLKEHPVKTIQEAEAQVRQIIAMVQKDALSKPTEH